MPGGTAGGMGPTVAGLTCRRRWRARRWWQFAGSAVTTAVTPPPVTTDRGPMDVAFPLRFDRKMACVPAGGIAVHSTRQLVVVAGGV